MGEDIARAWVGIANVARGIGHDLRANREEQRQVAFENEQNFHLEALQKAEADGTEYTPDFDREGFDATAYQAARLGQFETMAKDDEFKRANMERIKKSIDTQHVEVLHYTQKAEGALQTGDTKNALSAYEKAYENVADGTDLVYGDDGKSYTLTYPDGTTETKTFPDQGTMIESFRGMSKQFSDKKAFAELALSNRQGVIQANAKVMSNPTIWRSKKGELVYQYEGLRDPDNGKVTDPVFESSKGQMVDKDYLQSNEFTKLSDAKTIAEIEDKESGSKARGIRGKAEQNSPEGKLADDLYERGIFDSADEAMRYVVEAKQAGNADAVLGKLVQSGLAPGDEEYDEIAKRLTENSPKLPAKKKPAAKQKGLPKEDTAETPPVKGARKAKDGKWYVQKDGKYYLVNK